MVTVLERGMQLLHGIAVHIDIVRYNAFASTETVPQTIPKHHEILVRTSQGRSYTHTMSLPAVYIPISYRGAA